MFALRRPQHDGSTPREHPKFSPEWGGVRKKSDFGVQKISNAARTKVTFVTNDDEYEVLNVLSIVPTSTTLDDFEGLLCSPFA